MAIFVGSADPATRAAARQWNADEQAFHRHRARLGLAAPTMSPGLRRDVTRKLGLDEQATSEEIYRAALEKIERMKAEGKRRADKDAARIGDEIDAAVARFPSMGAPKQQMGASRVGVIGLELSRESRRLVAMGAAPDLVTAQRLAVARDPSILRR